MNWIDWVFTGFFAVLGVGGAGLIYFGIWGKFRAAWLAADAAEPDQFEAQQAAHERAQAMKRHFPITQNVGPIYSGSAEGIALQRTARTAMISAVAAHAAAMREPIPPSPKRKVAAKRKLSRARARPAGKK